MESPMVMRGSRLAIGSWKTICRSRRAWRRDSLSAWVMSRPSTVTVDTGTWRDFGFGMVSFSIGDAKAIGMYDAANEAWGYEDVDFFRRAQAAGYMNWRLYDTNIVHVFHPKNCDSLEGTDRFNMCLGSKLRMEGTKMQIAVALMKLERA